MCVCVSYMQKKHNDNKKQGDGMDFLAVFFSFFPIFSWDHMLNKIYSSFRHVSSTPFQIKHITLPNEKRYQISV